MGQHGKHGAVVNEGRHISRIAAAFYLVASLLAGTASLPQTANTAPCRQALALGVDVSGSVDDREYRLQLDGIANALRRPEITEILTTQPERPVVLTVYEWSGSENQRLLVPWHRVTSPNDIIDITQTLTRQVRRPGDPSTALGKAMLYGANLLREQPDCWQHTLDISGDGMSNSGPRPDQVADDPLFHGIFINALVISPNGPKEVVGLKMLSRYFEQAVIRGPYSFVEETGGYEDYSDAMARKLLRELSGLTVSGRSGSN